MSQKNIDTDYYKCAIRDKTFGCTVKDRETGQVNNFKISNIESAFPITDSGQFPIQETDRLKFLRGDMIFDGTVFGTQWKKALVLVDEQGKVNVRFYAWKFDKNKNKWIQNQKANFTPSQTDDIAQSLMAYYSKFVKE